MTKKYVPSIDEVKRLHNLLGDSYIHGYSKYEILVGPSESVEYLEFEISKIDPNNEFYLSNHESQTKINEKIKNALEYLNLASNEIQGIDRVERAHQIIEQLIQFLTIKQ